MVRIADGPAIVAHRRLLHPGRRRRVRLGPDRRRQRAVRRLRDGRHAARRGEPARLAARRAADGARRRGAARRPGRRPRRPAATSRGGHSVDDPEPKYGMAVTGLADPDRLLRNDAGRAGLPLTLTKPLGIGVLNSRHKATGEVFPQAVARDDDAQPRRRAGRAGRRARACATDVTGFGLLGHLLQAGPRERASPPCVDAAAVPYLDGAREALRDGLRQRRHPAQPRLGPRRTSTPSVDRGRAAAARRRPDVRRPAGRRRGARATRWSASSRPPSPRPHRRRPLT